MTPVPAPDRRLVDLAVVRRLIDRQFPQWSHLPIRPVAAGGWDNQTFHLGDHMSIRLPTAGEYAKAVAKEHRWLPYLAPRLPLPIPVPLAMGEPGEGFAFSWSVYAWLDGEPAATDLPRFAGDLAGFLVALRGIDATGAPGPGLHNWFRGSPLRVYDESARQAIDELGDRIPRAAVTEVWEMALRTEWDRPPVWFHGDVARGNLLVRDGALAAVIDFGTCGAGDPACDLVIAWTLLTGPSRQVFRDRLGLDDDTWARGRGWALWKALITYADDRGAGRVLDEILADRD